MKLTNHEKLLVALHPYRGATMSTKEIWEITHKKFPEFKRTSCLPNDHSQVGNKGACSCVNSARTLVYKIGPNQYQVA